jgi:hypothetical protein
MPVEAVRGDLLDVEVLADDHGSDAEVAKSQGELVR